MAVGRNLSASGGVQRRRAPLSAKTLVLGNSSRHFEYFRLFQYRLTLRLYHMTNLGLAAKLVQQDLYGRMFRMTLDYDVNSYIGIWDEHNRNNIVYGKLPSIEQP